MREDILYFIALTMIKGVGPMTAKTLIGFCGGAKEVFNCNRKKLQRISGIGKDMCIILSDNKIKQDAISKAKEEIVFIEANNILAISFLDDKYPKRLKSINSHPIVLYYKGKADLNTDRIIAIVGTRSATQYGLTSCEKLVEGLESYNLTTISGLAYGIDAMAHSKSVELGIPTIAVLGNGFKNIYPAGNRKLAERIIKNGAIISEFHSGLGPEREHFPMRNRIVSALSEAMVVVETKDKGGSMISAEIALEEKKHVFAFPGRVGDEFSEGCNYLIKHHKATLVEGAKDIADILKWEENGKRGIQKSLFVELDSDEQIIIDIMREKNEEVGLDELFNATEFSLGNLSGILLTLEFKGMIKALPGKRFLLY